ncbi:MAG: App1 family protein [Mariniphaga sp.]
MIKVKKQMLSLLYAVKLKLSAAKLFLGKKLGLIRSLMILPYDGIGNKHELFFLGRVLRDRGIGISQLEDSKWKNFSRMYKRFMTWEIPNVKVKASFKGFSETAVADEEGYFRFEIKLDEEHQVTAPWKDIHLELTDRVIKTNQKVQAKCRVYIPSDDSEYGIISDIDDTIVPTGATRMMDMMRITFFRNAHTRVPFPGVAAFYQSLAKGTTGKGHNPFFYVSSSPWNLYDFLKELMEVHGIPQGPLLLRDIGLSRDNLFSGSHSEHKLMQVERIFRIIEDIPFILVGDSGQHDAEIYLQVIKDFPGRVKMIYIRDVSAFNHKKVKKIAEEVKSHGVEMMLVNDTIQAAHHALTRRWISDIAMSNVSVDKAEDEAD